MGKRVWSVLGLVIWVALGQLSGQQSGKTGSGTVEFALGEVRGEAIRGHMRFLADPLLEGRAPEGRGYAIAARYVQSELEGMGLKPAGTGGDWYQQVPLRKSVVDGSKSSLSLAGKGGDRTLTDAQDYIYSPSLVEAESVVSAPVMFVGFGVTAPEQQYDDYAGVDVKGKIVAMIAGAPSKFASEVRAYYSDGLVKGRNAVAHGAAGVIDIELPEDWKRYTWEWLVPQFQAGDMRWLEESGAVHNAFPELKGHALLSEKGAAALFADSPMKLDAVYQAARAGKSQSFALPVTARMKTVSAITDVKSPNIAARLDGSDARLKDEFVVYTAHVDHLGICPPVNGDSVCHGAVDNGSGTASLLEIARAYARLGQAPRRSVLFVFVTGEEMGLLGSDYFAWHPTVPEKKLVANVNVDEAPGIYYAMKDVVPMGSEHSSLGKTVVEQAARMGYSVSPDPMPEEVGFIRSDQYSFVLRGIPAVQIIDGVKAVDPKIDGLTVLKQWLATRYHTPADNMEQPLDYDSAAKGARLNFMVGYTVAQEEKAPTWNAGDFFGQRFGK
jgi:Peptidase family M28